MTHDKPKHRDALRSARLSAGLTMAAAARGAGYKSRSGWAMVEAGINTPPVHRMLAMARVVGAPASEIFEELQELQQPGESIS